MKIDFQKALQIISEHTGRPQECIKLFSTEQKRWGLYKYWNDEPCWYAQVEREELILCGSWIVAVSKETGNVLFSGPARNEG